MFVGAVILVSQTTHIDLFGLKAKSESLFDLSNNLTGLKFCDSDGFPRRICRKCYKRLKQFSEFKALCLNSRSNQEREPSLKRGEKVSESPVWPCNGKRSEAKAMIKSSVQNLRQ